MVVLVGCGGDGEEPSAVDVAQARVAAAKDDLADAEAGFTEDSEAFCGASEDYILALDRYADVLSQTAVTVGDVTEAGADLGGAARRRHVGRPRPPWRRTRTVLAAEQELAEAKAELAAAKDPGSTPADVPSETASPEPLLPAATVSRVEQAEQELEAVQRGISERTPLEEASQQFNAAVVALQMSWLRLFADAGCLTDEQQVTAEAAVRDYTSTLQTSLAAAGYYDGEVDGVYGPQTVDAVVALQEAHGLPTTGTVDKATAAALEEDLAAAGGASAEETLASTAAVQQTLKLAGYWDGPVDGEWTDALTEALQEFQTALGVKPTGTVDAATVRALEKAIAEAQETLSETPSPSEDESEDRRRTGGAGGAERAQPERVVLTAVLA